MTNFYRLNDKYILRGWDKLPYAVIDTQTDKPEFIDAEHMNALKWCSGNIDITIPLVSDKERAIIHEYAERGIVDPCEKGQTITKEQEYKFYPVRYINSVQWSTAKFGEVSHDEAMYIISQLEACGIRQIHITGGEPLVRSDFWEIIDLIIEHGIRITEIFSNGALVNEKFIDGLKSRNLHLVMYISYDGVGWHDWLRGVKGAEGMAERAIKLCTDNGFPVVADMCLHKYNQHTIRESVRRMASLGVSMIRIGGISNTGSWKENNEEENALSHDELFRLYYDYLPQFFEDNLPISLRLGGFFSYDYGSNKFSIHGYMENITPNSCLCSARMHVYISPEGRVLPCMPIAGTVNMLLYVRLDAVPLFLRVNLITTWAKIW